MKEILELLGKLTEPGTKILDRHGVNVGPRYRMEIATWPKVLQLRAEMKPFEQQTFGRLKKQYSALRNEIRFLCDGFLREHLDYLTKGLDTGDFQIQQKEE